ncbi:MAG: MnmC family methyltransferase [Cyanobacteriota bacterium]|nr:MnmC family methyltransferase [Cyanobacteriota bacterium]
MTWPACAPELQVRTTADGSFSLFSRRFGEAFHAAGGALGEARQTFVGPAELERFGAGTTLVVLDVCVGTGSNTAALIEACARGGLCLQWRGLELDPHPLQLALADQGFCGQWRPGALDPLRQLATSGRWRSALGAGELLWGDARRRMPALLDELGGQVDLVLMDAFSPRHCPELWTLQFLGALAALLAPQGRLLTYCSAAAVRAALQQAGLQLAAMSGPQGRWSGGTAASPGPLLLHPSTGASSGPWLRALTAMEREHLRTNAAVPYSDPSGQASAAHILQERSARQRDCSQEGGLEPTSASRRRWGLG